MKTGIQRIEAERKRQIEAEGYDAAHDDKHDNGELEEAGHCYANVGDTLAIGIKVADVPPEGWPWEEEWWKIGGTPERCYEKAGALFLAESDRLERAGDMHGSGFAKGMAIAIGDRIDALNGSNAARSNGCPPSASESTPATNGQPLGAANGSAK